MVQHLAQDLQAGHSDIKNPQMIVEEHWADVDGMACNNFEKSWKKGNKMKAETSAVVWYYTACIVLSCQDVNVLKIIKNDIFT